MPRGIGRPVRRIFGPDIPPLLQRANQLMAAGNYVEAASAYEQLARAAEARNGPRAPFFFIQAGRARMLAGQTPGGMEYLERGLGLFATRGKFGRVFNIGHRVVGELNQRSMSNEAKQITEYLKKILPEITAIDSENSKSKLPPLPTHCTGCGAPVRPDEVEWLDDVTAECAFCGSPLRGA